VKQADTLPGSKAITIGLYNRKANLGGIRPAVGFNITFSDDATTFRRVDVADTPDLASGLSVRQRMAHLLAGGAMSGEDLATEINVPVDTIKRTRNRYKEQFTVLTSGNFGLLERHRK
jgi:hypothetical protein